MKLLRWLVCIALLVSPAEARFPHGTTAGGCASTGTFDLSNTCNDIYFIGALK